MFARQVTTSKTCWWVQPWAWELKPKKKRTPGKLNLQKESVDSMRVKVKITTSLFLWCCSKWPDHRLWSGQLNVFNARSLGVGATAKPPGRITAVTLTKKKGFWKYSSLRMSNIWVDRKCERRRLLTNIVKGRAEKQAAVSCAIEAVETVLCFFCCN